MPIPFSTTFGTLAFNLREKFSAIFWPKFDNSIEDILVIGYCFASSEQSGDILVTLGPVVYQVSATVSW